MKTKAAIAAVVLGVSLCGTALANPVYTYVGSWIVGDGPLWSSNPPVYSGQSAAALLFGGNAADYVTSTVNSNPADINFKTFLDGYGNTEYLTNPASDTYSLSSNGGGYDTFPSFSAYILDHTCENRYSSPSQACLDFGTQFVNYAFRVTNSVSEPATFGLMLMGLALAGAGIAHRMRKS